MHKRKTFTGVVSSNKMDKTVVVTVSTRMPHPLYKKVVTLKRKFYAHDEQNRCKEGDAVTIVETRPLSKTKRWRVLDA